MEPLESTEDGCLVNVYATPRASRTQLCGLHDGMLKIQVAAPPVDGAANKALIAFLSSTLGIAKRSVRFVSGETGKRKVFALSGVSVEEAKGLLGL